MAKLDALNVTFHAKLGTQGRSCRPIRSLAAALAKLTVPIRSVDRAIVLAKADLRTEAVGEFPELQASWATNMPFCRVKARPSPMRSRITTSRRTIRRVPPIPFAVNGWRLPTAHTLVGFWAIDEKPTGSKDPYALRRAHSGVIRLILGGSARLPLLPCFDVGARRPEGAASGVSQRDFRRICSPSS